MDGIALIQDGLPVLRIVAYASTNPGPDFSSVLLLQLMEALSSAQDPKPKLEESIISSLLSNEHHSLHLHRHPLLQATPALLREGHTTSPTLSIISTPLGQNPGATSLICGCEKAASNSSLYTPCSSPPTDGSPFLARLLPISFITGDGMMTLHPRVRHFIQHLWHFWERLLESEDPQCGGGRWSGMVSI